MRWMRRWGALGERPRPGTEDRPAEREPDSVEEWEALLLERGVPGDWARRLASPLCCEARDLGPGSVEALIRSAVVTMTIQAEVQAKVERHLHDVREVERLLGAFSGELEKLDEVLEVLSAYAQRMRTRPSRSARDLLH